MSAEVTREVQERFTNIATQPANEKLFPVGAASARKLGYDADALAALPQSVAESFCGVGNPFALGEPQLGQTVLDLGCGAGLDVILAAQYVGARGKVIGLDMTEAMVQKACANARLVGARNVEFYLGQAENVPVADETIDLVISNGLLNLCPDKERVLSEVFRLLRPGGRLQMCDILLHDQVTQEEVAQKGTWSD